MNEQRPARSRSCRASAAAAALKIPMGSTSDLPCTVFIVPAKRGAHPERYGLSILSAPRYLAPDSASAEGPSGLGSPPRRGLTRPLRVPDVLHTPSHATTACRPAPGSYVPMLSAPACGPSA